MRYISDDGKFVGTENEVLNYEQKQAEKIKKEIEAKEKAEKAKAEKKAKIDEKWNEIKKLCDNINTMIDEYKKLTSDTVWFVEGKDNHIKPVVNTYNEFISPIERLLYDGLF